MNWAGNHKRIYLDYGATTPCAPEVVAAMLPFFSDSFGNPSSAHLMGREAAVAVECARDQIAGFIGCDADELFFTGGATESNNISILGAALHAKNRRRIVVSAVEHKSVLEPCAWLAQREFSVVTLPVDRNGIVDLDAASHLINDETLLVSVQGANNETGTIQPIAAVLEIAQTHGALIHSDCAQMLGKVPVSMDELGIDYASFSGHKVYGPKGIGLLFAISGTRRSQIGPICFGGGQENHLRPGTLNVPAIVGLGEACRLAARDLETEMTRIGRLRDSLEKGLRAEVPDLIVNGAIHSRLPGTTNLTFPGVPADILISQLPDVCLSDGSACNSGAPSPSHVIIAMGCGYEEARCALRISMGRYTNGEEIEYAVSRIADAVRSARRMVKGTSMFQSPVEG